MVLRAKCSEEIQQLAHEFKQGDHFSSVKRERLVIGYDFTLNLGVLQKTDKKTF